MPLRESGLKDFERSVLFIHTYGRKIKNLSFQLVPARHGGGNQNPAVLSEAP
jgi:hypothetical protein